MSFWTLSDGEKAEHKEEHESAGGNIEPLPDDTDLVAFIDEAKWTTAHNSEETLINIRWRAMKPECYKNRVLFQKMWVLGNNPNHKDPKKQGDNAKRMFAAIDTNTGGGMTNLTDAPTDEELQRNLLNKPMIIKTKLWEMTGDDGQTHSGNWVCMVSPNGSRDVEEPSGGGSVKPVTQQQSAPPVNDDMGDIPF